jgi:surface antigen
MVGSRIRLAAAASFCLLTAACAGMPDEDYTSTAARGPETHGSQIKPGGMQCVTYARERSGINIHGDASEWWDKSQGLYAHEGTPLLGSLLVLTGYAGPHRGHLAVVSAMVSDREIRVDHANWLNDGAIFTNDPVVDVSADNDWSQVRVWNPRAGAWGSHTYLVQGFIGPGHDDPRVAETD